MAGLVNDGKHLMLEGLAGGAVWASLHTADPSTDGSNEVTGGSPAYTREAISWASATSGSVSSNTNIVFAGVDNDHAPRLLVSVGGGNLLRWASVGYQSDLRDAGYLHDHVRKLD